VHEYEKLKERNPEAIDIQLATKICSICKACSVGVMTRRLERLERFRVELIKERCVDSSQLETHLNPKL
jgi:hypothetical protein